MKAEGTRQYETLVRSMLDLTDNLVDGSVVHPPAVVVADEDDPYLVVAADKGTATFSDTANAISAEYGFWLGDAFASGGSTGYDHKKLGITARGAWESVKRHFREIGTDVMNEPFTVVGIGDMSGDVFGNGLLYSDQICLVAAFDHRHVFVDPAPNPAVGFAERKRLFELPGSSWDDYDRSKISEGGGVWPRSAKSIEISPETRLALGIDAEELSPSELISAILRAPVDLLYNGGIGTYVKATTESDADAGDRVNDDLRVDGKDLRCRVVAEGGNLGFTQRGRIEFALGGGRINTDFIDNSAGVDTSDHEVNLKILLGLAVGRGQLTMDDRNALLAEVEEDVVRHVLYDNFLQAQILSQEAVTSAHHMEAYEDLMVGLETREVLDRELEALPERRGDGRAAPHEPRDDASRARRAPRVREAEPHERAARVLAPGLGLPRDRPARVLPAAGGRAVRRAAERAPAASRADRDAGRQRRRELAGHHVRLARRDRDRGGRRRRHPRVPDRPRRHGRRRTVGGDRGARRHPRARAARRPDGGCRRAGGGDGAVVPAARPRPARPRDRGARGTLPSVRRGGRGGGAGRMATGARTRRVGPDGPGRPRTYRARPRAPAVPRPRPERGRRGPAPRAGRSRT